MAPSAGLGVGGDQLVDLRLAESELSFGHTAIIRLLSELSISTGRHRALRIHVGSCRCFARVVDHASRIPGAILGAPARACGGFRRVWDSCGQRPGRSTGSGPPCPAQPGRCLAPTVPTIYPSNCRWPNGSQCPANAHGCPVSGPYSSVEQPLQFAVVPNRVQPQRIALPFAGIPNVRDLPSHPHLRADGGAFGGGDDEPAVDA